MVCLLWAPAAFAQDFFQQSPGPLSTSHAAYEGQENCGNCHTTGKQLSNDKCLGCHEHSDMRARIASGKGLHASSKIAGKSCWNCHLEHKGRSFDVLGWAALGGRDGFDHSLTGFDLVGKHRATTCNECHRRTNKAGLRVYLGESRVCGNCHKDDQPHRFERAEMMKCDRCHSEVAWKPPRREQQFDHNDKSQASFPLEGTHVDVACAKCHAKAEFNLSKSTTSCAACHENVHKGQLFGEKSCSQCHSPKLGSLSKIAFDHGARTKFKLEGKHASQTCYSCHAKGSKKKPDKTCESCHAKESPHADRFAAFGGTPPNCATCHPQTSWKPDKFNHGKLAGWTLTGKHAQIDCRKCHRGKQSYEWERFDLAKNGCMGCHQHQKVHEKKFKNSECLGCHKMPGSMEPAKGAEVKFHGPDSDFPLTDSHAGLQCDQCHKKSQWKISADCGTTCHEDSLHRGSLGKDCQKCHQGGTWVASKFDHDKHSKYKLIGEHEKTKCNACHVDRQFKPTPTTCGDAACHLNDDAHSGKLGKACERCHRETGESLFEHNTMAAFKLTGGHLETTCASCHKTLAFKPQPKDCFGCHPEPKVHKGQFGTACASCHDTKGWAQPKPIHDVGNFSLGGSHANVDCRRCHKDSRPLAGTGPLCVTCHRADDIHSNSLGPKCGDCHTQWAFAPARFDHLQVGCELRGLHRTLPCADCHKAGNFGGLAPTCASCHWDDAKAPGGPGKPDHMGPGYADCGSCHRLNTFLLPNTVPIGVGVTVCR
jgi:Class III cytochrome C family